jgi:uncharacterized protein
MMRYTLCRCLVVFINILCFQSLIPASAGTVLTAPAISIIIDDIGYRLRDDRRALALPGNIAYAIMPLSPNARSMSKLASNQGKIVLLHLPMQAIHEKQNRFLGPGALRLEMTREEFMRTLDIDLRSLPEAIGVNNHMGSLLSRQPGHMEWLMETLNNNNKFYIDSVTIHGSVAGKMARKNSVPYLRRDIFLDNKKNISYIQNQFELLISLAKRNGRAIGIGHPHPETIQVLMRNLYELDRYGVMLVSLLDLIGNQPNGKFIHHVSMSD